ncbi:COX15/CtaA family protein [Chitinibacter bivalviorum]|uniref:COX15/CtaA family protein n=1 Tax=Chitinibacter bivalviorum TaxID=2739434 RepID=A0A7H9BLI2_9NEIS|nr:COX15/CtaA family protein [Chitinibacter bivalviorum]QLG89272.1 COX15/CtaA family protein [Chitinibacter bivalviorum]
MSAQKLLMVAIVWTACLMMLGAYVRLQDAGLGCPDWPGCYGQLTAPDEAHEIARAQQQFGGEVHSGKGRKEMIHRYVAGGLGLLVLWLTPVVWRARRLRGQVPALALLPLLIIVVQALFGMLTVTLKLMPIVVTGHLVGGMSLLMSLIWLASSAAPKWVWTDARADAWLGLASCVLVLQILLGAWVSTNYAALACDGFPLCRGQLLPPTGLLEALHPNRALGLTADGMPLQLDHLAAIHWAHRAMALVLSLVLLRLIARLWHLSPQYARSLLAALLLQLSLGIGNVLLGLPLALAIAHQAGAALLLGLLVYGLTRRAGQEQSPAPVMPWAASSKPPLLERN